MVKSELLISATPITRRRRRASLLRTGSYDVFLLSRKSSRVYGQETTGSPEQTCAHWPLVYLDSPQRCHKEKASTLGLNLTPLTHDSQLTRAALPAVRRRAEITSRRQLGSSSEPAVTGKLNSKEKYTGRLVQ